MYDDGNAADSFADVCAGDDCGADGSRVDVCTGGAAAAGLPLPPTDARDSGAAACVNAAAASSSSSLLSDANNSGMSSFAKSNSLRRCEDGKTHAGNADAVKSLPDAMDDALDRDDAVTAAAAVAAAAAEEAVAAAVRGAMG